MNRPWRWMHALLTVATIAAIAGCGASARRDFDLNSGESTREESEQLANELFLDDLVGASDSTKVANEWIYEILPGDRLEITFFTHPEQNRMVVVRPDGRISLPFVGEMVVAGRHADQISDELEQRYAEVLVTPHVDVLVQETNARYYVLGQVASPGEFAFTRPVTLTQALARAGGYTNSARLNNLVLLRRDAEGHAAVAVLDFRRLMDEGAALGEIRLQPSDIVWVPRDNIGRFDNAARRSLVHAISVQELIIKGWSLANFEEVFQRNNVNRP